MKKGVRVVRGDFREAPAVLVSGMVFADQWGLFELVEVQPRAGDDGIAWRCWNGGKFFSATAAFLRRCNYRGDGMRLERSVVSPSSRA